MKNLYQYSQQMLEEVNNSNKRLKDLNQYNLQILDKAIKELT
jgi:hypothetical protein